MATFRSSTLTFNALWEAFGTEFGLLPDLALDAVLARYKQGEPECIPRIVELVCTHSVPLAESAAALAMVDLQPLSSSQRRAVEATLDRWWLLALSVPADDAPADADSGSANSVTDILGILAGFDAPMRRWLHVWLENFDGVGAKLFTEAVLHHATGATESQAWRGKHDEWTQFQAWCRAEPTVMGFALVGGTHVEQQDVTAVLEQLV